MKEYFLFLEPIAKPSRLSFYYCICFDLCFFVCSFLQLETACTSSQLEKNRSINSGIKLCYNEFSTGKNKDYRVKT